MIQHAAADWKNGTQDLSSLKNTELVAGLALVFAIHFQKLNIDLMLLVLSSMCQTSFGHGAFQAPNREAMECEAPP